MSGFRALEVGDRYQKELRWNGEFTFLVILALTKTTATVATEVFDVFGERVPCTLPPPSSWKRKWLNDSIKVGEIILIDDLFAPGTTYRSAVEDPEPYEEWTIVGMEGDVLLTREGDGNLCRWTPWYFRQMIEDALASGEIVRVSGGPS